MWHRDTGRECLGTLSRYGATGRKTYKNRKTSHIAAGRVAGGVYVVHWSRYTVTTLGNIRPQ